MSYGRMMLWAAIPYGLIWLVVIYFVGCRIQKDPSYDEKYEISSEGSPDIEVTHREKITTIAFIIGFLILLIYSMITKQKTAYTIFVMVVLALEIMIVSGIGMTKTVNAVVKGMSTMAGTFFLFVLLDVMLQYINYGRGFEALGALFLSFVKVGSRAMVVIMGTLVGSFGINGGAVAQLKVTNDLFLNAIQATHVPMEVWALALICGSRVTTSIYPGSNMIAPMGLARSESLKAMLSADGQFLLCQSYSLLSGLWWECLYSSRFKPASASTQLILYAPAVKRNNEMQPTCCFAVRKAVN